MKLPNKSAPAAVNNRGAYPNYNPDGLQGNSNIVGRLLDRLERVEKHGTGYRAKCPAHDGKSAGSLSIVAGDDGRILIHCFGGCDALEIVHALGLELSDLFEKRITVDTTFAQRRELWQAAKQSQWVAALEMLEREAGIVQVAATQTKTGEPLNEVDTERLTQAIERIESARKVLNGR